MDIKRTCVISRYDNTITKPPYQTLHIDTVTVYEPEDNSDYGVTFSGRLTSACKEKGYSFRFYTSYTDSDTFDYEIVVE